jgi:murein DD-endopeptidase MepM/ murein hydrolase activator NlpD
MVLSTVYAGGYGLTVEIEHRNNYTTKYAHLSVMFVKKGEFVKKGQLIALVGTTGNSTGPHLHFEIRSNDIPLDPLDFLPRRDSIKILHTLKNWK